MKMTMKLLAPVAALGLMAAASSASAYMVNDVYWGGNGHGYGDVIGPNSTFDISGADASLSSGTMLTVKIYTNFAGYGDNKLDTWATNMPASSPGGVNMGLGYGDLFLSTGWTPNGTPADHYTNDNAATGNHWTYAFSLDNRWSNTGGSGSIYALGSGTSTNHNPDTLLSQDFLTCTSCIYRNGQEVAAKTAGKSALGSGTWSVIPGTSSSQGYLSFTFDIAGLNLDPNNLGFHWDMSCGNDTIEGKVSVPEPGTVALLGLGLIGLGFVRRRRTATPRI